MRERLQSYLTNTNFTIKVAKIDAAAAISELKQQIRTEVMGLTASPSGKSGGVQAPDITTAQKELNILTKSADSIYRRVSSVDGTQAEAIVRQYRELSTEIQKARTLEGDALLEATANIQKKVAALRSELDAISSIDKIEQQRVGTLKQISQLEGKLDSNLTKTLPGRNQSVGGELSALKLDARVASSGDELAGVRSRYLEVAAAAKAAGLEAQSFGTKLQGEASKLSVWALATTMIMGAVRAVKDMAENVKRLDMELIELKKVTDLTRSGYEALIDDAAVSSRVIGATLSDTIRAQADFAKLGYDVQGQGQNLAQAALVYKHVGDGIENISEASESIISTMKAFGIEAKDAMGIVDAFNEVGNKFAISSSGIGEAMQRSSASLASANNTLEESIGLTVAMNNVIQNPDIVGTALKTVSMYLRAAKADLEAAGESTDGMATSTSKLRESLLALTKQKVDIQLDENTFKSTYQIMKEISAVWSDIADIDQAALLELLGGKRNATAVVSLLTNFSDTERALEVATNSAGSALQENEKWLTGIEGHSAQFAAAFENLSRKIIDSEMFKGLIDTGTAFVDVLIWITDGLDKLTGGLGGIPVAVAAITAAMGIMSKNGVKGGPFDFAPGDLQKAAESVKAFGAHFQKSVADVGLFKTGVGEAQNAMQGIKTTAQHAGDSIKGFWAGLSGSSSSKDIKALLGYSKELATINEAQANGLIDIKQNNELAAQAYETHIASVDGLKESTKSTATAMQSGAVSAKAFANSAGAIGVGSKAAAIGLKALSIAANMLFNMAIAAAITASIKGIDNFIHRAEIAAEKAREAAQAANEVAAKQEEGYKSLVSLVDEYRSLSATGQIDTANLEKARDIQNQIVKIVGNQVDGLDLVNGASEAQLNILREQLRLRAEDARIAATAAYNASLKATETAQPQESKYFGAFKGAYISKVMANDDEKAARDALKSANLWKDAYDTLKMGFLDELKPDYEISLDFDVDGDKLDTIYKKIKVLRDMIEALESDENIDVTSNSVYLGLVKQVQEYEAVASDNIAASVRMLESVAASTELGSSDRMAAVKSVEEFNALRTKLIGEIAGNTSLAEPLKSGAIELTRINAVVDSILARNIPEWFDAARDAATESTAAFVDAVAVMDNLGDSIDNISKRQKILQAAISEMGDPAGNGGIGADTVKSIQDALTANERLTDYITVQNGVLRLNAEAWNNRTFGDITSQIDQLRAANNALEEQNALIISQSGVTDAIDLMSDKYAESSKQIEENTAAIEANQEALELYQAIYDQLAFVDIWDFANIANDLASVQSAAGGLISAMQQLRDGTALTKVELAKLAIQYPELLSAANLFTDGSIAGQRRILDAALQTYEAQYDGEIDKDIAILEATNQLLQDQIDLEDAKSAILAEISVREATGRVSDAVWLQERLAELNDLEGENYVTMENGKLRVNQEALEKTLAQTASYGQQSSTIWSRISTSIGGWFETIAQKARNLAKVIANALTGKTDDTDINSGANDPALLKDSDLLTIEGQAISAWSTQQEAILAQRRKALNEEIDKNLAAIDNLQNMKGLDLTSVYSTSAVDGLRDSVRKARDDIVSDSEDMLKSVVNVYDTLNKATTLHNLQNGNIIEAFFPSVSTFQSLMDMESKYLNYLNLGSGAITMNRLALKKLTAARVEDLAVTKAMALVDSIAEHRNDAEALHQMADATHQATDATWDLVYAKLAQQNLDKNLNDSFTKQIDSMRQLSKKTQAGVFLGLDGGIILGILGDVAQKIKGIVSDMLKEIKAFVDEFINALKQTYKDMLNSEKSGLDEVLKLTMDLIKYEVEQKVKGLKDQIAAYKEIVDLKKQELDLTRQQADYEDGIAERVAEIAKLQAEIAQLKLDDSREAAAARALKEQELAEKQKDLAKYQDDHAYDEQIRALDDAAEAYEKAKQKEIEELEETISSAEKVYQLAVKRLEEDFWGLYEQVIEWNTEAGSSINKEITEAWKEAAKAVVLYGGYLNAVKAIEIQLKIQAEGIGAVIADLMVDAAGGFFVKLYDAFAGFLNKFLKYVGVQLPTSDNTGTNGSPINPGKAIFGVIGDVIGGAINGIVNGVKNFVGGIFGKFPFFHTGGHVGGKVNGRTSDPAEEVIAVLQTDEVVLTKQQQKNLLTQLDFLRELGANVDAPVSLDAGYSSMLSRLMTGSQHTGEFGDVSNYGNVTVSAPVEVIIQHSGVMDDATAARFGKKVAETTVGTICEAFRKKGIYPGGGNGALKP